VTIRPDQTCAEIAALLNLMLNELVYQAQTKHIMHGSVCRMKLALVPMEAVG